jgi:ABC-type cobalamin/Fe3+-siderophores transport system ATPase subunit
MLKRLYVHNYKCLVNFQIDFDKDISLLLGANGSGKSSALTALYEVQKFINSNIRLDDKRLDDRDRVFKTSTLTRWGDEPIQKFEIEIEGNNGIFKYALEIEHQTEKHLARVIKENLFFDSQPLYKFFIEEEGGMPVGKGRLFNDNKPNKDSIAYASDWSSSGLGSVQERYDNKRLIWFKKWLERLFILHINPNAMKIDMDREESHPELDLSNYVAWLSYWNNENREGLALVESQLRKIINGFSSFRFPQSGLKKILEAKINKQFYRIDELSDGQKALAILYTLIYCIPENATICIDEPENFLALPEIQPWLNALEEQCREKNLQAVLISHHPSLINLLAPSSGYWFSRQDNHTRIEKITEQDSDGLSLAQLIEIGWIYGD